MRWFWIDCFVEFVSGQRASAVKNVTLAEECLAGLSEGYPVLPATLMIEGMAQTAGILVGQARQFRENVILAKIRRARFEEHAGPGDQLRYEATIETIDDQAAVTRGTVYKNGKAIGSVDLMFSHVNQANRPRELPDHNFVFTPDFMSLLDTVRSRLQAPREDES